MPPPPHTFINSHRTPTFHHPTPPPRPRASASSPLPSMSAPPPTSAGVSRRLPPPCWSPDETAALIDAYRDKWYSLRRGNLRATHWQEVADDLAGRCPCGNPPKTSIQCRHKMEKLRKRYRLEIQRDPSSWVHFKRMESMDLGSSSSDLMLYPKGIKQVAIPFNGVAGILTGNGTRIKIPNIAAVAPPPPSSGLNLSNSNRSYGDYPPLMNRNPLDEMVEAIQMLGDGFVKVEKMKMDMARELESMRMKMEVKRTEMIVESHKRLVNSFSETVLENKNKKIKRMLTPES